MAKSFIFMPEDEPGEMVYGFPENAKIMELAARRLKLNEIPVGNGVAAAFPWMRMVSWDVDDGAGPSVGSAVATSGSLEIAVMPSTSSGRVLTFPNTS